MPLGRSDWIAKPIRRTDRDGVRAVADRSLRYTRGRTIHRVLMEKTSCDLFYEIDEAAGIIRIVSAWGAVQGRPPRL